MSNSAPHANAASTASQGPNLISEQRQPVFHEPDSGPDLHVTQQAGVLMVFMASIKRRETGIFAKG